MALTKVTPDVSDIAKLTVSIASDTTTSGVKSYVDTGLSAKADTTAVNSAVNALKFYDIAGSIIGKPANGASIARFVAVRAFSLPASLTGSVSKAGTAATGAHSFTIAKNGTSIGSINWGAGGTTATFTFASSVSFVAGDVMTITAPATADSTLADVQFTLVGTLA